MTDEKTLRLALRIVTGRESPINLYSSELEALGFDHYRGSPGASYIRDTAEDILIKAILKKGE